MADKDNAASLASADTMTAGQATPALRDSPSKNNNHREDGDASDPDPDHESDGGQAAANEMVRQFSLDLVRSVSNARGPRKDGGAAAGGADVDMDAPAAGGELDPALDPASPTFDARRWTQALLQACAVDPERYPRPTAGVAFRNLTVHGYGSPTDYQKDVLNVLMEGPMLAWQALRARRRRVPILRGEAPGLGLDGLVKSGEMLLVLGRPGSGVTTMLKTVAGETRGLVLGEGAHLSYQGIPLKTMQDRFRGEVVYQAETDVHFPMLTVGQTLRFAAEARTPRQRPALPGLGAATRAQYAQHLRDVVMAVFGIAHTVNTRVGNDLVRGVSGGERKRVSIAEAALSGSAVQCWDNATRGLDSATALAFARALRTSTDLAGTTALVAMYQASEAAYALFDQVCLLYEGRLIYFGRADAARAYFERLGYACPPRQTTADFLTSLTSPGERRVRAGVPPERVPRTPDEFAAAWRASPEHAAVVAALDAFDAAHPMDGRPVATMAAARRAQQAALTRPVSPFTLSFPQQVALCIRRGVQRLRGDVTFFVVTVGGNLVISLVLGSVFYQLADDAASINARCILVFFAILFNALSSALEILSLYAQRPIVEKHARYALYRPAAEAVSSFVCELPSKILSSVAFNVPLYFMADLRHGAGPFFIFLLFSFVCTLTMSTILRTIGQTSRTVHQALTPAAIFIIALVIYTGFVLPKKSMQGWMRWISYINPIGYAYESLLVNELGRGRAFPCTAFVPPYAAADAPLQRTCATAGALPGADAVSGTTVLMGSYDYRNGHLWRNLGILFAFMAAFMAAYVAAAEYVTTDASKGEVLVFRRGHSAAAVAPPEELPPLEEGEEGKVDAAPPKEEQSASSGSVFHWHDVCYDIPRPGGGGTRRLLDHVDGWVKPGTLTVLMGVSGAGKTTLLDVLADRVTMGVVTGSMCVDGVPRGASFQRTTGYVQQQDVHLATTTVREALRFSAELRLPRAQAPTRAAMEAHVEEVIALLEMGAYADAVVGVPGEGLNVEQRKRLTIGVELAAKPDLLLFLDEPTSGLDSQTAWSVTTLVRRLADHGQAVLCTIHQPSALLFQQFDRLLLLAAGGRTVYFGDIGPGARSLIRYFEAHRSVRGPDGQFVVPDCAPDENPAEWMLKVIGAAPGAGAHIGGAAPQDWPATWRASDEYRAVQRELERLEAQGPRTVVPEVAGGPSEASADDAGSTYARPFAYQLFMCTRRVFEQYWRTPSYIYAKLALCFGTSLFIGLSFRHAPLSETGLQSQLFAIFMLLVIFAFMTYQTMPHFIAQRELFEVRERAARTYHWAVFVLSNVLVELPWNTLAALLVFLPFYYLVGMDNNARNAYPVAAVAERGGLFFALMWVFFLFESTFADMVVAGAPTAELGATVALLLFAFCLIFCGVMVPFNALPGFWIFMYRVSPLTYLIGALLATGIGRNAVTCTAAELLQFQPPANTTCGAYLQPYMQLAGGALADPAATDTCRFCPLATSDAYLASIGVHYSQRWRNFGLMWAYVVFNLFGALALYWLARAPKPALTNALKGLLGRVKVARR